MKDDLIKNNTVINTRFNSSKTGNVGSGLYSFKEMNFSQKNEKNITRVCIKKLNNEQSPRLMIKVSYPVPDIQPTQWD